MLDILAAIFIDTVAAVNPTSKEDTNRILAEARRRVQHERDRHFGMAAQIGAVLDSTLAENDRVLLGLDPLYRRRLDCHRRRYGLPPIDA